MLLTCRAARSARPSVPRPSLARRACATNATRPSSPSSKPSMSRNVLGKPLESCCTKPLTGFYRDGYCRTDEHDQGRHVVCAVVTDEFLKFSRQQGNDLITPRPEMRFPGLKAGDKWCLCALRWREAYEAGKAPPVVLASTAERALQYVSLDMLKEKGI